MPATPLYLIFPLISSVAYVAGILLIRRSADFGVGLWRTTFISNAAMGLCFSPLWLLGGHELQYELLWQPLLGGALFFIGQIFTFIAQTKGDVSVATPVLGLKILMVALASTWLLGESIPLRWWLAAGLGSAAVALLGLGPKKPHHHIGLTIASAALAATAFALADVLVQKWAGQWGLGRFLPLMFGSVALASVTLIPFFSAPLQTIPAVAWRWIAPGATLIALQASLLAFTLGTWGHATAVNIVYSARGVWSIVAIWLVGHWFANREQQLGKTVLVYRLSGALLLLAAITLVVT